MTGATVDITFADAAAENRFVSSYLPEAWERYEASDYWDQGWYWSYSQFQPYDVGLDGGLVRLVFDGDPDGLLAAERDRWDSFAGLTEWSVRRYDEAGYESLRAQQTGDKGEVGGDWEYRYKPLVARLGLALRGEFDEPIPPSPDPSEGNPRGIGFFGLVHALFVMAGYDWHEETDTYVRGIQNRCKSIAAHSGADAARAEYQRICGDLAAFEDELEEWIDDNPTGEQQV
jgi:hypothetical protein